MKKHYQKSASGTFAKVKALLMLLCVSGIAQAQLSGNYTIDATKTTGGTNYASWSAFASAIGTSGVSGAVKVTVMNNETTASVVTFNAISGASSTNTITIDGNGTTLSSSSANEAIHFNGADYISLSNLTIQKTGTGTAQTGIRFSNASDYNTLNGLTIEFTAQTSSSTAGGAYIAFASATSLTTTTTGQNGSFNSIKNCMMRTTNSNAPGPTYGIIDQQSTSFYTSTANNNTFEGNTIRNFFLTAIYNRYTNGEQFIKNDISRLAASSSSPCNTIMYGIWTYYTYGTNRSTSYKGNNFHDMPYAGASASSTSNYINTYYTLFGWYQYGSATNPFTFDGNTTRNVVAYSQFFHTYLYYAYCIDFTNNIVDKNQSYTTSTNYTHWMYYCYDNNIINNTFTNNRFNNMGSGGTTYLFYNWYNYNSVRSVNVWEDNRVDSNSSSGNFYTTYL
ncbi:MAG: hypothetical protein FJ333_01240, partial [Sphingomonadales bacterium]|nr:hypothetical protein [Sphingomonadales bacterium]